MKIFGRIWNKNNKRRKSNSGVWVIDFSKIYDIKKFILSTVCFVNNKGCYVTHFLNASQEILSIANIN